MTEARTSVRRPAMSDVAAVAGVSHQTVSRVLNEHPSVRPQTRERVLAAIADLGYRRNNAARSLVTRRTGVFGVVIPATTLFGPTGTLVGLEQAARDAGYLVSVAMVRTLDVATMAATVEELLEHGVDGLVMIAPTTDVTVALAGLPSAVTGVVITSGDLGAAGSHLHQVGVDQRGGAREATQHLLDLGHREVVHVAGPQEWFDARERLAGWRDAMNTAGLTSPVLEAGWTADDGARIARQLLAEGLPSAIFAANDQLALGLLHGLWEAGIRVPQEVSVVGFDDEQGAAWYTPALTTVRQDFTALGELTIRALLADPGTNAPTPIVPTELVVRASTGPARTR